MQTTKISFQAFMLTAILGAIFPISYYGDNYSADIEYLMIDFFWVDVPEYINSCRSKMQPILLKVSHGALLLSLPFFVIWVALSSKAWRLWKKILAILIVLPILFAWMVYVYLLYSQTYGFNFFPSIFLPEGGQLKGEYTVDPRCYYHNRDNWPRF